MFDDVFSMFPSYGGQNLPGFGAAPDSGFSAGYNPAMGQLMVQNPDAFAKAAASAGIPPPSATPDASAFPPISGPMQPGDSYSGPGVTSPTGQAPSLGESMQPKKPAGSDLASTLRGVAPPKPPEVQKISSPRPTAPHGQIPSGRLVQLLQAIGAGAPRRAF